MSKLLNTSIQYIENAEIKDSLIYKVKVNFIKAADYTKTPHELEEVI